MTGPVVGAPDQLLPEALAFGLVSALLVLHPCSALDTWVGGGKYIVNEM